MSTCTCQHDGTKLTDVCALHAQFAREQSAAENAALRARLAEAADWIVTAHQSDCSIFWRNSTACSCGRDALYHRITSDSASAAQESMCEACKGSGEGGYEYVEGIAVGPSPCRDCHGRGTVTVSAVEGKP